MAGQGEDRNPGPLNTRYQHFSDSEEPIRLLAITSFPFVLNATNNENFVFKNPFLFTDLYNAEGDYLQRQDQVRKILTKTNFVPNALKFELDEQENRGKGATHMGWDMSGNTMLRLHVYEIPPKCLREPIVTAAML